MNIEEKLKSLGWVLPPPPKPVGAYQPLVKSGKLAFLSGQISKTADGKIISGKVGKDLQLEEARTAARAAALNALSIAQQFVGLENIARVVRLAGFIQVSPDFYDLSKITDAASDMFLELFGERGIHARSTVGMASLPLNAAVEIELILEVK